MIGGATRIPIAESLPRPAVFAGTKDVAFAGENEIRTEGKFEIDEAGLEQIDRASGIDGPERAAILQFANQLHALSIQDRFAYARNNRAVEIGAEKFDFHVGRAVALGKAGRSYIDSITSRSKSKRNRKNKK